jgi:hypothetical protein
MHSCAEERACSGWSDTHAPRKKGCPRRHGLELGDATQTAWSLPKRPNGGTIATRVTSSSSRERAGSGSNNAVTRRLELVCVRVPTRDAKFLTKHGGAVETGSRRLELRGVAIGVSAVAWQLACKGVREQNASGERERFGAARQSRWLRRHGLGVLALVRSPVCARTSVCSRLAWRSRA